MQYFLSTSLTRCSFCDQIQEDVIHEATPNPLLHSIPGIDPPPFVLVQSQIDDEHGMGEANTEVQVPAVNLHGFFDQAADPMEVPETPPARQGISSAGGISTYLFCIESKFFQ